MQLQTIVCYGYIYDSIFITKFLKSNMNYTASRSAPDPQWKILAMHLVGHRGTTDREKLTLLLNYGQKMSNMHNSLMCTISKHTRFSNVYCCKKPQNFNFRTFKTSEIWHSVDW